MKTSCEFNKQQTIARYRRQIELLEQELTLPSKAYWKPEIKACLTITRKFLKQAQNELPREERSQIVLTTHSHYLVDKFDLDELVVVEKHEGATVCTRPMDKAHLRGLLDREKVGLGDLFYSGALGSA